MICICGSLLCSFVSCKQEPVDNPTETPTGTSQQGESETIEANPVSDFEYIVNDSNTGIFITKYVGDSEHVVIPAQINNLPVLTIQYSTDSETQKIVGAFENSHIRSVCLPDSVRVIFHSAFQDCSDLTQVLFGPNFGLEHISGGFENCTSLESIDLSTTKLKQIDSGAFSGCTSLKEVKFPDTLLKIGEKAFYQCTSLLEVHLPINLSEIESEAFGECTSLKRVVIPPQLDLTAFDSARFYHNFSLKQIVFEEGREAIDGYAFFGIDSDLEIIVPKSVKQFSPMPFIVDSSLPIHIKITFLGNCPEIINENDYFGIPTIYYDPDTKGWDAFAWKDKYQMEPIQ